MSLPHSENRIIPAPVLSTDYPHDVYESGVVKDVSYRVVKLDIADTDAILSLYEAEKNNITNQGKHYLLDRDRAAVEKMFKNGVVLGAVVGPEGHLGAIGAVTRIADIGDMGRGNPYTDNGNCTPEQQVYFKSALVHPDWQKGGMGLMGLMYPHRVAEACKMEGRKCIVLKSNNQAVKDASIKNGMEKVDSFPLPEDSKQTLDTFKISIANAAANLKVKRPDVYQRHALDKFVEASHTIIHDVPQDAPTPVLSVAHSM